MTEEAQSWSLQPGASWIDLEGRVYRVRGFHEEWLADNAELSGGARNVCELVLAKRWISATLFGGGYLELMVHDRHDPELRGRLLRLLVSAKGRWEKALVMAMDEEGYAMLKPKDADDTESLARALERGI
ncbi:MAG: hypothetical protein WCL50_03115 [Spirochaetota bacterium]